MVSRACSSGASVACRPKYNSTAPSTISTIPTIFFVLASTCALPLPATLLRLGALEARRGVRIAPAFVARDLRMRAQRPRHRDLAFAHRGRRERRRLRTLLDPARERGHPVDLIGSHAAAAVSDAGQHEEPPVFVRVRGAVAARRLARVRDAVI